MGLDLTLIPLPHDFSQLAFTRMSWVVRNTQLFEILREVAFPFNKSVSWYDDDGLTDYTADPYGEQLTWMPAGVIAPYLKTYASCEWDRAIHAFIDNLDSDTRVVLWWC